MKEAKFNPESVSLGMDMMRAIAPHARNTIQNMFPKGVERMHFQIEYLDGVYHLGDISRAILLGEVSLDDAGRSKVRGLMKEFAGLKHPESAIIMMSVGHIYVQDQYDSYIPALEMMMSAAKILDQYDLTYEVLAAQQAYEIAYLSTLDYNKAKLLMLSGMVIDMTDDNHTLHLRNWDQPSEPESELSNEDKVRIEMMRHAFYDVWLIYSPFDKAWLRFVKDETIDQNDVDAALAALRECHDED